MMHTDMKSVGTVSMQEAPLLEIAVVGHTNTGKTSLIRTLLRSTSFGRVDDAAGTTRHVERATILPEVKRCSICTIHPESKMSMHCRTNSI